MSQNTVAINRIVELEIRLLGGNVTSQQLAAITERATQLVNGFGNLNTTFDKTSTVIHRLSGNLSGLVPILESLGFKKGIDTLDKYNRSLLSLDSQFTKYGTGLVQVENKIKAFSDSTRIARSDLMDFMSTYEKSVNFPSLDNGIKMFKSLKNVVGDDAKAITELGNVIMGITSKFPELQDIIDDMNNGIGDKAAALDRLENIDKILLATKKISFAEAKRFEDYINNNKKANPEDEKRRKEIDKQVKAMNDLQKTLEDIERLVGQQIMPLFQALTGWIDRNRTSLEAWVPVITKIALGITGISLAMKGLSFVPGLKSLGAGAAGAGGWGSGMGTGKFSNIWGGGAMSLGGRGAMTGVIAGEAVGGAMTAAGVKDGPGKDWAKAGASLAAGLATGGPIGLIGAGVVVMGSSIIELVSINTDVNAVQKDIYTKMLTIVGIMQNRRDKAADERDKAAVERDKVYADPNSSNAEKKSADNQLKSADNQLKVADYQLKLNKINERIEDKKHELGWAAKSIGESIQGKGSFESELAKGWHRTSTVQKLGFDINDIRNTQTNKLRDLWNLQQEREALSSQENNKMLNAQAKYQQQKDIAAEPGKATATVEEQRKVAGNISKSMSLGEIAKQSAALEATQSLIDAKTKRLEVLESKAQYSSTVDIKSIRGAADAVIKDIESQFDAQEKYLTIVQEVNKKEQEDATEHKGKIGKAIKDKYGVTIDDKNPEAATSQVNAIADLDKRRQASELLVHYKEQEATVNTLNSSLKQGQVEIENQQLEKSKTIAEIQSGITKSYDAQLAKTDLAIKRAQQQVDIANTLGAGFHASAEQYLNVARASQKQVEVLEQQRAIQQELLDQAEQSNDPDIRDTILKKQNDLAETEMKITEQKKFQLETVKQLRDGYISAISASMIGSGMITKFTIDANKNVGMAIQHLGVLSSMTSGGMGHGSDSRGARSASGFSGGPGGGSFYGPNAQEIRRPDTYDGGNKIANEAQEILEGASPKSLNPLFRTYADKRISTATGENAAIGGHPSYIGRMVGPQIGTGTGSKLSDKIAVPHTGVDAKPAHTAVPDTVKAVGTAGVNGLLRLAGPLSNHSTKRIHTEREREIRSMARNPNRHIALRANNKPQAIAPKGRHLTDEERSALGMSQNFLTHSSHLTDQIGKARKAIGLPWVAPHDKAYNIRQMINKGETAGSAIRRAGVLGVPPSNSINNTLNRIISPPANRAGTTSKTSGGVYTNTGAMGPQSNAKHNVIIDNLHLIFDYFDRKFAENKHNTDTSSGRHSWEGQI